MALAALAALLAAACASEAGAPEHTAAPGTAAATRAASTPERPPASPAACTPARPHAAGDSSETLASGGAARAYLLHVPPSYDGSRAMPLVLNFHGFGSNARQQAAYSALPAKGDDAGFITIAPDGTGDPRRWDLTAGSPDVAFVGALLDDVAARLCIDTARVFATGISNGAAFSARLACDLPDRIRAIGAVAALVYPLRCDTTRAMPVIALQGTEDPCVPFEGGVSKCGMMLPVPAAEDAARNWARHDGCNLDAPHSQVTAHVRAVAYSECADRDAAVILYIVYGGGHTWPGAIPVPRLGATTDEVRATDLIWEFFAGRE